jgi:hypothetical protein
MNAKLPKGLIDQFAGFVENHPPQQFGIFLRKMLLEYIGKQSKIGFHVNFSVFLWGLEDLFDLLDQASLHIKKCEKSQHCANRKQKKKTKNARKSKILSKR